MYTWDLRTRRCRDRFVDEGTVKGTALACGRSLFATGSDSGAVNLHARSNGEVLGQGLCHRLDTAGWLVIPIQTVKLYADAAHVDPAEPF